MIFYNLNVPQMWYLLIQLICCSQFSFFFTMNTLVCCSIFPLFHSQSLGFRANEMNITIKPHKLAIFTAISVICCCWWLLMMMIMVNIVCISNHNMKHHLACLFHFPLHIEPFFSLFLLHLVHSFILTRYSCVWVLSENCLLLSFCVKKKERKVWEKYVSLYTKVCVCVSVYFIRDIAKEPVVMLHWFMESLKRKRN